MTNVKYGTFGDCSSLTKVTIPKSIINIRGGAFYGCGERIDVYYEGTREEWNQIKQPDPLDDFAELSGLKYGSSYYDSDNDIEVSYGEGYYVYIHCNSVISGDNRQDAFINVDNNSLSYTKTYGDAAFQLQGISKIGDGTLVYTVTSGKDVVEVSPSGMVTIKNIGEAAITISMDATEHYRKAKSKIIWITVNKEAVQIISDYQYSVESNGEITITGYTGKETSILVPAEIDGKKVTAIGESAFYGCDFLQSVILPEGITSIKGSAFGDCEFLRSVILPKGITNIGSYAFSYSGLRNIVLPEGITNIGSGAFSSTGLKSIILFRSSFKLCTRADLSESLIFLVTAVSLLNSAWSTSFFTAPAEVSSFASVAGAVTAFALCTFCVYCLMAASWFTLTCILNLLLVWSKKDSFTHYIGTFFQN